MNQSNKELFLSQCLSDPNFCSKQLPSDASFRKYERIHLPTDTFILMDASNDKDSIAPFIKVGEFLHNKGYSAPKIISKQPDNGFLLLEDLGENSYSNILNGAGNELLDVERKLYKKAIELLIDLHNREDLHEIQMPHYNTDELLRECSLLVEWYLPTLNGKGVSEQTKSTYINAWKKALECLHYNKHCLVLRDYHVDNLIWLETRTGIKRVGLLDFQDAVIGSYAYDVVSLLEDARRDITASLVDDMINYYLNKMPHLERKKFISDYKILGVQRACKIIGIFSRKATRDNDGRYLKHLSRLWNYIKKNIHHPLLEPVRLWFASIDLNVMKGQ